MTRTQANLPFLRYFLLAWVSLGAAATLLQALPPLGLQAGNCAQSWWTERRFQQAVADLDLLGMHQLGKEYLHHTGNGELLDFAIYTIGFAASGPSMNRVPSDALDWAVVGGEMADQALHELSSPWEILQTQAHTLVERAFPLSLDPQHLHRGLQAMERWLASGGGRNAMPTLTSKTYQDFLRAPPADRPAFLLRCLGGESSNESQE